MTISLLKDILDHLHEPWLLDSHPWAQGRLAQRAPGAKPGERLVQAIRQVFRETMPSAPPRRGKRLDTRWGEFGLLAAQYFAPLAFGLPRPRTQREAWQAIDSAILLFVFGADVVPTDEQRAAYRIVGDEPEIAPNSTISGWNSKALDALLAAIVAREEHLAAHSAYTAAPRRPMKKILWITVLVFLLVIFALLGWKGYNLARRGLAVKEDVSALQTTIGKKPGVAQLGQIRAQVATLRVDLDALQGEAAPLLGLAPAFGWVPGYGGEISQAADLLQMANGLTVAADEGLQALGPAAETALQNGKTTDIPAILTQLQAAEPRLLTAQVALAQAIAARQRIDATRLSPTMRDLLTKRIDPLLNTISGNMPVDDALTLVRAAPTLLGVGKAGPQTYLLLLQNEDELRPTGGFITAVGSVVINNGALLSMQTESIELVDDLTKPYPRAPWQLNKYMLAPFLVLRDSNWFTDYPATAQMAEYLYSYTRAHSVDGVIAINQHVVVELLRALGPVRVEGVSYDISADNVLDYMRSAKQRHSLPGVIGPWDRKQFIGRLAKPIIEKVLQSRGASWGGLTSTLFRLLDEHHILLQFDDPTLTSFLARRHWDGAVRPATDGDFLMAVNANVGFNKSNAVVSTALSYSVDLSDTAKPTAHLDVEHTNHASGDVSCVPRPTRAEDESDYPIDECHWSYLRIYRPAGTRLLAATPHAIPAESTLSETAIPAQVDDLHSEDIPGAQVFGTLVLVRQRETVQTGFDFALPAFVLQPVKSGGWTYTLTVQKQPGTLAVPLTLKIRLPQGASLLSSSLKPDETGPDGLLYNLKLVEDVVLKLAFAK